MSRDMLWCHKSIAVSVVSLVLTLPGLAFPQHKLSPGATDASSKPILNNLDSQLLQGLGDKPAQQTGQDQATAAAVSGQVGDSAQPGPGNMLDPFAEGSDIGQQNPLIQIGRQMRRVEQLLIQRNVAVETQQAQRQIVDQLDELIDALAASQQVQKQQKSKSSSTDNQQASKTGREANRNGSGKPIETGADGPPSTAMQGAVGEFWGHLPERLRSQMRSSEAIEFLPKYRKLIEDYYKRLAEDRGIQ